jgi:hypothetical protein
VTIEIHWTGYFAMATGIIGAITGTTGAILGLKGYRRGGRSKSQDLRIQLRKNILEALDITKRAKSKVDSSIKSRTAVSSATGHLNSGFLKVWMEKATAAKSEAEHLGLILPTEKNLWANFSDEQLEDEIVRIHGERIKAEAILKKYEKEIGADDEKRRHLRDQAHRRAQP